MELELHVGEPVDGRTYRIIEPVTITGVAAPHALVSLFDQATMQRLRAAKSGSDGQIAFGRLLPVAHVLVAIDAGQTYQAVAISHRVATFDGVRAGAA